MTDTPSYSPVVPTGTMSERMVWAALTHITAIWGFATWMDLKQETGSTWRQLETAVTKLVCLGIATREMDSGVELLRLKPEYRHRFSRMYRRLYPLAEIEGGGKPHTVEPTVQEDMSSLRALTDGFPDDSLLAFALERFPYFLTEKARDRAKKLNPPIARDYRSCSCRRGIL
jgi:hypothetical protein